MRKIIHIDMDAFFASVEQRDNPALAGRPIAVGRSSERGVVAAASYEARRYGVRSAMPSVTAKRKCPDLIFVPHRMDVYKAVSRQIHKVFKRYTNLIEPLSLDEAYLDVTENKPGLASATEVAATIKLDILQETGLTASAGVSINKFLAKIASDMDKPDGLFVIRPADAQAFIDALPIEKFFGIGRVTAGRMRALGIRDGASLKAMDPNELVRHFGKAGHYFFEVANGRDSRPVITRRTRKSVGAERTFAADLTRFDDMLESLQAIAQEVGRRLMQQDQQGRTVTLKIKFSDFRQITRSQTRYDPISAADEIIDTVRPLLTTAFRDGMRVRLLGISLSNLESGRLEQPQMSLQI